MSTAKNATDDLTARQRRILEIIHDALKFRGYPPSIREIGNAAGLQSTSSVSYQLKELEQKGYLRRDPNKPRAIIVDSLPEDEAPKPGRKTEPEATNTPQSELTSPTSYVPLVGSIAAGVPITAEQNTESYLPLPTDFVGASDELFMLEVKGDSMIDAGILDGDFIIVRGGNYHPETGDIVAARLDDEATVKEFQVDDDGFWLVPHNPTMQRIDATHADIQGQVVSLLRRF
ncbi:MAG: transcriptional repressor LexA [Corynebacterium sp.]|nr:transcriptional repressor LexA [Corynebacterium sp.]